MCVCVIAVSGEGRDGAVQAEAGAGRAAAGRRSRRSDIRRPGTVHHTALRHAGQSVRPTARTVITASAYRPLSAAVGEQEIGNNHRHRMGVRGHPALSLHSSNEPAELSRCLWS